MKLIKRILILKDIAYHLKNRKIFNELVERKSSESKNLEKKLILTIWFISTNLKEKFRNPNGQNQNRNYQNLVELFKNLKDGNINPKKVLKN